MATDVAVIGLACRFPGDADNVENFWNFVCDKRTSVSEKTPRWNVDAFYSPKKKHNTSITKRAHYLKQDIAAWDAKFFDISKAEAEAIDPQQRIFLEVVYEALENAGLPMQDISGSRTGVFVGSFTNDYSELAHRDPEAAPSSIFTGTNSTSTSNRVSWFFNLKGPSFTLNTACSSSLVALHLACQSLKTGDCDTAIVGGVNLLLNPDIFIQLSNQGFLAADGQSKSFDASGDGYGRGDGFAAMILRRADDAIELMDPIRAVIRGTACNQDGRTRGFTLPSADAQAALTEETYRKAGLDYSSTLYVEAHGTGTQAGDAEETFGLAQTIAANRSPLQPLLIGSVKSNIGHLEGCAGLAGLIKTILILEKGVIPPTYGLKTLNPKVKWSEWNLEVPAEVTPWPGDGLRRISTQGFGYGGTNAHVILDDARSYLASKGIDYESRSHMNPESRRSDEAVARIYTISAQDRAGLQRVGKALAGHVKQLTKRPYWNEAEEQRYLYRLAYTLAIRRSNLQWSTAVVASSSTQLSRRLKEIQSTSGSRRSSGAVHIGFIFTGQGAQWPRMGMELMALNVYKESVQEADKYLRETCGCGWSVQEELARDENFSLMHQAEYSQTLTTVLQVALVDLFRSWGIRPSAVVGHSSGEIAAAYCAGLLKREDAWKVAYFRGLHCGQLKKTNPGLRGAMMVATDTSLELRNGRSWSSRGEISVACFNSPSSITYAGDEAAIDELLALLQTRGLNAQKLLVEHAYHSPHMHAVMHDYMESIEDIESLEDTSNCIFFSSVHGEALRNPVLGPAYWARNLGSPVRFDEAVRNMLKTPMDVLVEIGPHDTLRGAVAQIMQAENIKRVTYTNALKRNTNCVLSTLDCAGTLLSMGASIDLMALNRFDAGLMEPLTGLPAYPWNHSHSFWWESRLDKEFRSRKHGTSALLGAPQPSFGEDEWIWRGFIRLKDEPWVRDHVIQGQLLYPAAGFLAMAFEAGIRCANSATLVKRVILRDVTIRAALIVPEHVDPEIVVVLRPSEADRTDSISWLQFTISSSIGSGPLRKNCSGFVRTADESTNPNPDTAVLQFSRLDASSKTKIPKQEFYTSLAGLGLEYGEDFAKLDNIEYSPGHSFATLNVAMPASHDNLESGDRPHIIHPATLDAGFHLAFAAMLNDTSGLKTAMVPTRINELVLSTTIAVERDSTLFAYAHVTQRDQQEPLVDISVLDDQMGELQLEINGLSLTEVPKLEYKNTGNEEAERTPLCYELKWRPESESTVLATRLMRMDVIILEARNPSLHATKIAEDIVNSLHDHGMATQRLQWPASHAELGGYVCISLVEIDEPFLDRLSRSDFERLQEILMNDTVKLTWVGKDEDPTGSLMSGLVRTIHNEVANAQCRTLRLDRESMSKAGSVICKYLESACQDVELRAFQGVLHSSRIEPDLNFDNRVFNSSTKDLQILDPEGVYILVGGLGGIGRSLAMLLVELGARKLCFLSRAGAVTKPAQDLMVKLQGQKVRAVAYSCDVGDATETQKAIQTCMESLGPIRGVIQCAMSLQDVLYVNMTHTQWIDSHRPKVQGTRNLHEALPPNLDFFIILSSFAGIFGNRGQANYAAACNYQDAFAQFRRSQGLKAVTVDLGIIRDVGVLAEKQGDHTLRLWEEHFGIREVELHKLLKVIIEEEVNHDASTARTNAQIITGFATATDLRRVGLDDPYYFNEPRFSVLKNTISSQSGAKAAAPCNLLSASISQAETIESAAEVVANAIVDWLATKLQTSVTEIDPSRPVHSYGVDSLLAVEVTQWVFQRFRAAITVFELLSSVPITSLAENIAKKSADLPVALK